MDPLDLVQYAQRWDHPNLKDFIIEYQISGNTLLTAPEDILDNLTSDRQLLAVLKEISRTIPGIRTTPGNRRRRPLLELVSDLEKFSPSSTPVIETLPIIDSPSEPVSPWDDDTPLPSSISETSESADESEDEDEIHYGTAPSSIIGCGDSAGVEGQAAPTRPSESYTSAQSSSINSGETQQYRAAKLPYSALQIFDALPTSPSLGHFNSGNDLHDPTGLGTIPEIDLSPERISPSLHSLPLNVATIAGHVSHAFTNDFASITNEHPPTSGSCLPSSSVKLFESEPPPYSGHTDTLDNGDASFSLNHRIGPLDMDAKHSNYPTNSDGASRPMAEGHRPDKSEVRLQGGDDTTASIATNLPNPVTPSARLASYDGGDQPLVLIASKLRPTSSYPRREVGESSSIEYSPVQQLRQRHLWRDEKITILSDHPPHQTESCAHFRKDDGRPAYNDDSSPEDTPEHSPLLSDSERRTRSEIRYRIVMCQMELEALWEALQNFQDLHPSDGHSTTC